MENKDNHCINENFADHITKELTKELNKELKKELKKQKDGQLEEDFLKRKEENDRYFFS